MNSHNTDPTVQWDRLGWPQIAARIAHGDELVVLPVGAIEQHGMHLPTGVDTWSAEAVARAAAERTGTFILPTLPYGCSLGHTTTWPGTLSLRTSTLTSIVCDLAEWLHAAGIRKLIVLNGHITNFAPLRCALEEIRHATPEFLVSITSLWDLSPALHGTYHLEGPNWHANAAETSLMMHLAPECVDHEAVIDEPDRSQNKIFSYPVNRESETGLVGNPSDSTAEAGAALFADLVDACADLFERARAEQPPLPPHGPIPTTMAPTTQTNTTPTEKCQKGVEA